MNLANTAKQNTAIQQSWHGRSALRSKQKGMSFLGVFFIVGVFVFLGIVAFKVVPNYFEYMTVSKIADDVANNKDLMRSNKSKIYGYIDQAYRTNNLWDLKSKETIQLTKDGSRGYKVQVNYEKRTNLFSNIDVVTAFDKEAGTP